MLLKIYGSSMALAGIVDDYVSVKWVRKYQAPGYVEVVAPMTSDNLALLVTDNYIARDGVPEACVIESVQYDDDLITANGRMLSSILDRRVVFGEYSYSGAVETGMRALVNTHCISSSADRVIPGMELGAEIGGTGTVDVEMEDENLLDALEELCETTDVGFRVVPNWGTQKLVFECYKGLNRSASQSDRPAVVFSPGWGNVSKPSYTYSVKEYKNVVRVDSDGGSTTVGTATGLARRETQTASKATTASARQQDGNAVLAENRPINAMESEIVVQDGYRVDWDLGDTVTLRHESWNVSSDQQILEVEERYSSGVTKIIPTVGNPIPDNLVDVITNQLRRV